MKNSEPMKLQRIRVVDVLADTTQEEAEALMNAPCNEGFVLDRIVAMWSDNVRVRAFFRNRLRSASKADD